MGPVLKYQEQGNTVFEKRHINENIFYKRLFFLKRSPGHLRIDNLWEGDIVLKKNSTKHHFLTHKYAIEGFLTPI